MADYILASIKEGGAGRWVLSKDGKEIKQWPFAPKWWVLLSCLLHGWWFPKVRGGGNADT